MAKKTTVRVAFIDVGQGDTIIISVPETHEAVIVDCFDAEAVICYLEKYDIRYIRGLIITHLHRDHCKGVIGLIANVKSELNLSCDRILYYLPDARLWERIRDDEDGHSDDSTNETFKRRQSKNLLTEMLRFADRYRDRFNSLAKEPDKILPLPGIIEFLHPWRVDIPTLIGKSLNDISGVLKIKGNGTSAILTGDLEPTGWDCLKRTETDISGDVLKFPHHGAWKDGDPQELLESITPSVVVISVGTDGVRYNHPNRHVLESLKNHSDIRVLCTQVTNQCENEIELKRETLIRQHEQNCSESDAFFVEQKGCPCAGTIIIELGNSVEILQPSIEFHKDQIIKSFISTPQCC